MSLFENLFNKKSAITTADFYTLKLSYPTKMKQEVL